MAAPLRPLMRWAMTPDYDATSTGRRVRGWEPGNAAVNALLVGSSDGLRSKSRDAVRRNPWAKNAVDSYVANAIGSGIVPQSKHPDPKVRSAITELWQRWTDESDADGITDFYGQQTLACRESIEGGECLARLRPRRMADGLTVPLQIQLLEAEHLPTWKNEDRENGFTVRAGIEFNAIGKRVAYWLYPKHPFEILNTVNMADPSRVPAEGVLHLYQPLRAGQHRGQPWLTVALPHLYDLQKYDEAENLRKQLAAMMAFFVEDQNPESPLFPGDGDPDDDGVPTQGLEPGSMITLPAGKTIKISEPADVGGMYSQFMAVQLRKIAACLGVTYEQLTGDLTGVNYSSIRAGLLEFRRRVEQFQHQVMVFQFCRPTWKAWIEAAVLAGELNALDYSRRPEAYLSVEWRPQAWPWVDPLKDIEAQVLAIDNLLTSRTAVIRETGYDAEAVDAEIAADQEREKQAGLERRGTARAPQVQDVGPKPVKRNGNAA